MQLSSTNDVKIYNLSAGKSVPEWISSRQRRKLEQKDIDIRRRIQLIQDFDMPDVSNSVTVSPNGRYVFATGSYKPYVKCFDLDDISLKFARGLDADVIRMTVLSDDYSKFILLEEDRYLEMHAPFGRYFRMRIPRFGRDMAFCREASDLFIVGSSSEIFRLNLEQGQFLEPLVTSSPSLTCCEFNSEHHLFVCGTVDGKVEAWDHRDRTCVGIVDCAAHSIADTSISEIPQVSAVRFKSALNLAVGTSIGSVLLYDIRSSQPLLVKDHRMGLSIRRIEFATEQNLVLSMDSRVLKIWEEQSGRPYAAIEPGTCLTDFCLYPNSGLLFMANEAPRMLQYFIPSVGTAPKWCSYLETITEELEESEQPAVYDDYKFVTADQLEEVGLSHLIGTSILRAYMHGYFIDVRLYNKAKTFTQPFAYENYKQRKLLEKIDGERENNAVIKKSKEFKLPKVNRELAAKLHAEMSLLYEESNKKLKKGKEAATILTDDRFKLLFTNPDFQVDETSEHYHLINPALKKLEIKKNLAEDNKDVEDRLEASQDAEGQIVEMLEEAHSSGESTFDSEDSGGSGYDDRDYDEEEAEGPSNKAESSEEGSGASEAESSKKTEQELQRKKNKRPKGFEFVEFGVGEDVAQLAIRGEETAQKSEETLGELRRRIVMESADEEQNNVPFGGRQMTFKLKARGMAARIKQTVEKQAEHLKERKEQRRDASGIIRTLKALPVGSPFHYRPGKCASAKQHTSYFKKSSV